MNYQGQGPFQPQYPQRPPQQGGPGQGRPLTGPFPPQGYGPAPSGVVPPAGYGAPPPASQPLGPAGGYRPSYSSPGITSVGMSQNKAAGLSYLFRWISALFFLIKEKHNPFVRFHAMQSFIFFGGLNLILIVLLATIFLSIPVISFISIILCVLLETLRFVVWIIVIVRGFRGTYFRLPIIGKLAEKYAEEFRLLI